MPMSAYASTVLVLKYVSTKKNYRHIEIPLKRAFVRSIHSTKALEVALFAISCSDIFDDLREGFAIQFVPKRTAAGNHAWVAEDSSS